MKNSLDHLKESFRLYYCYAARKIGLPGYQIHQIYLPDQKLLYIPIPKIASTTVKHALFEIEFGKRFSTQLENFRRYEDHHDYYQKRSDAFTGVRRLKSLKNITRFAVIRDPVERLISCYRNRVIDLGDLDSSALVLQHLDLPLKPDINTFILNLGRYRKANKRIEHHSRPQFVFLDGTLEYLDYVIPMENLEELEEMFQKYKPGLTMLERKSGGTSAGLHELSEEALRHAIQFYQEDYHLLKEYYSPETIRQRYSGSDSAV